MLPQDSANYYSSGVIKTDLPKPSNRNEKAVCSNHYKAFMGYYEVLQRSHIRHSIIDEDSILNDDLSKYDLLILPVCACMRDEVANKIRDFVAKGGNLISEFDVGILQRIRNKIRRFKARSFKALKSQRVCRVHERYRNRLSTGNR